MIDLALFRERDALLIVAVNALLHEIGAPVPLLPTVMLAGAGASVIDVLPIVGAVVAGTLIGNAVWFAAGRRYGSRVLKLLCRLSLSQDSCVGRTEDSFGRWGASSLVIGRFVPGVSLVAPPVAGALGMSWVRFLALSAVGSAIWGLSVVVVAMLLRDHIDAALHALAALGWKTASAVGALVVLYAGWRWWRRRSEVFGRDVPRISVADLALLIDRGEAPAIVDLRGRAMQSIDARALPGAIPLDLATIERGEHDLPRDREVILYCDCPNEASAARAAQILRAHGFAARPLRGGLDAWIAAGGEIHADRAPAAPAICPNT
jgi:membrane protein DedA with SNARE-associated domain/rhodanese-related sulfurtransferase